MALEHPSVDILFHPTNRIIGRERGEPARPPQGDKDSEQNAKCSR